MTTKTIDLNALLTQLEVKIGDEFTPVRQVNARMLHTLRSIDMEDELAVYELAKLCLPEFDPDKVDGLTPLQVRAVLSLASDNITEVEALFPNLQTLTEKTAKPSATQARKTRSDTSSRASRSKRVARSEK